MHAVVPCCLHLSRVLCTVQCSKVDVEFVKIAGAWRAW